MLMVTKRSLIAQGNYNDKLDRKKTKKTQTEASKSHGNCGGSWNLKAQRKTRQRTPSLCPQLRRGHLPLVTHYHVKQSAMELRKNRHPWSNRVSICLSKPPCLQLYHRNISNFSLSIWSTRLQEKRWSHCALDEPKHKFQASKSPRMDGEHQTAIKPAKNGCP